MTATIPSMLLAALIGASIWSLAEYLLHRFAGHWPKGKIDFSREHLSHHAKPLYFTPTRKKVAISAVTTALLGPLVVLAVGVPIAVAAILGFLAMYTTYEVLHRQCHVRGPINAYGRLIRRHHFHHHFGAPKMNHGVTSPIWDIVFRTYQRPQRVKVPERHVMSWLVDESGEVAEKHQNDYEVRRRGDAKRLRADADQRSAFSNLPPS